MSEKQGKIAAQSSLLLNKQNNLYFCHLINQTIINGQFYSIMKKVALFAVLFSLMTLSAKAQWFDFSQNLNRGVVGFHVGVIGYRATSESGGSNFSDVGAGVSLALAGSYLDFIYVSPDHMYDSHIVMSDWEDRDAFALNVGYQIPIYKGYVFVTPLIGWSRVSTGITEGNNIGVDPENRSIFHKYHSTWRHNSFNYGGMITIVPCKYFELNASFTSHAAYGGISFNLANFN